MSLFTAGRRGRRGRRLVRPLNIVCVKLEVKQIIRERQALDDVFIDDGSLQLPYIYIYVCVCVCVQVLASFNTSNITPQFPSTP